MKIVLYDDYQPGVVRDDGVVDISKAIELGPNGQETIEALITNWSALRHEIEQLVADGPTIPLGAVRLRAPVPRPTNLLGMRVNYREGTGAAGPIRAFSVSPGAILDPGGTTVFPAIDFTSCRHEAELVCVVGRRMENVGESEAMDYVFGYTTGVDIGIFHKDDWGPFGKSCTGFKPIGPWIVTADELPDPHSLQVCLTIDGKLRQDYNTSDIAHGVAECLSWFSTFMVLVPGDIVFMGTNHQQVGPLQHGNHVEMSIERVGSFTFEIADPLKREFDENILADIGQRAIEEKERLSKP